MRVMLQVRHWVLRMLGISRHWYYECSIWGLATGCRRLCTKKQPEGLVFALPCHTQLVELFSPVRSRRRLFELLKLRHRQEACCASLYLPSSMSLLRRGCLTLCVETL